MSDQINKTNKMFYEALTTIKDELTKKEGSYLLGFFLQAMVITPEGEAVHVSSCSTSEFDIMIGRLELMKARMLDQYKEELESDPGYTQATEISPDIAQLLKNLKTDKPN